MSYEKYEQMENKKPDLLDKLQALNKIRPKPETEKEIILLRATQELSFREIGEIFGKTENWARVTYYRAKQKLL